MWLSSARDSPSLLARSRDFGNRIPFLRKESFSSMILPTTHSGRRAQSLSINHDCRVYSTKSVEGWFADRCEKSTKVMKRVISFTKTQDELASVAPPSSSYTEVGTRSIKRAGRSCCEKLEFIFPSHFIASPHSSTSTRLTSRTLSVSTEGQRWLTISVQKPLSRSLSLLLLSLSLLHFHTPSLTSLHSHYYTPSHFYSITSTMPSITSFLWSLVGVTTSKRAVRLHSLCFRYVYARPAHLSL